MLYTSSVVKTVSFNVPSWFYLISHGGPYGGGGLGLGGGLGGGGFGGGGFG